MKCESIIYKSNSDKSQVQASNYTKTHDSSHRFLAYRDIPGIIKKYKKGKNALDYGAGTGCSTKFLFDLDYEVTGVDISKEMLIEAQLK